MKELDKDNFDGEVLESNGLMVVDFWSDSCEECIELMPDIEAIEKDYADKLAFAKVNIKGNRRLAIREKVMGLPSILIYKDGEQLVSFSKEIDPDDVREKLDEVLGV
ncbi:MAG: thioredoxin family protein [Spirochaetales bacterium]|jgi:thioredoxin 1|nr:thioredoxin family protein [Spirochaetales bacterium]